MAERAVRTMLRESACFLEAARSCHGHHLSSRSGLPPRVMVQVMGKNTHQPLFRITVSTLDGVEMSFLVKRGYTVNTLSPRLWNQMLKRNIVSRNSDACLDLACDGVRMDWSKKLKDYNIRDDVDVLPALVVVVRRFGT